MLYGWWVFLRDYLFQGTKKRFGIILTRKKSGKINVEIDQIWTSDIAATEKQQLINVQRGQGNLSHNLINVDSECRLIHVNHHKLLIASHIKPWRDSTATEKLDGNNGLLLSPHIDKLFDIGYITFADMVIYYDLLKKLI